MNALGETQAMPLLESVARIAILADLFPIVRFVVVVVTAETARRIDVADVVGVGPESNVHVGKHLRAFTASRWTNGRVVAIPPAAIASLTARSGVPAIGWLGRL